MAKYLDKWKDLFPDTVGGTTRPSEAVSDQEEFNTDGFPQFIAQDPVNYALQNAFLKQFLSNDAWLWVKQKQANQALDDHKVDTQAHAKGISGNAGSATKLANARTINLSGAVTADAATFDGTANATINVKTLDATKLKGTASVSTTGNAATATKVVATAAAGASANIAEATMASSDYARIRVSGNDNAGELALETADDGSEPIVARQYTGIYTTPVRTAKILDESGNTSFPGTVVAPKFTGALNGNAATATKLQTARTLSLSGKATGSATFDGSANAAINVTSVNADTASKLSTARKINITGNATGSAGFDGTSDVNIKVSVSQAAHADKATADKYGADIADNYIKHYINVSTLDLNDVRVGGLYAQSLTVNATTARHYPENEACSILVIQNGANGADGCTQICTTYASHNSYKREYDVGRKTWSDWRKYAFEDSTVARALIANNLNSGAETGSITINQPGYSGYSPTVGGNYANVNISSWYGVSFTSQYGGGSVPKGKTAVGIDCREGIVRARSFEGYLSGNAATATKLATPRTISLTGNASGSANFDGSGNVSINTTVNESKHAAAANALNSMGNKTAIKDGTREPLNLSLYQVYNNGYPVSYGNLLSIGGAGGGELLAEWSGGDKGIGHLYYRNRRDSGNLWSDWRTVAFTSDINSFSPTKTGGGASGTWGINISGNAASATNADKLDGYHASDLLSKMQGVLPKTAAEVGQFRELVVNDSHQIKLPDGGTWAYFVYTYNSWSGGDSNNEHRTRTGAGIAAGGTVLHTDGNITSNTINAFKLSGTTDAGGADYNNIIVGGFCWRIA